MKLQRVNARGSNFFSMRVQRCLLSLYGRLLRLYPPAFRKRFAPEMLLIAQAADAGEWPLIFGDTSLGIVRCWLQGGSSSTALAEPNAYLPVGESPISAFGLFRGFVLTTAIVVGLCYASHWWYYSVCIGSK